MLNPDSIHKAVIDSQFEKESEACNFTLSCRVTQTTKEKSLFILERNQSSVSGFLRKCLEQLCKEYDPSHKE